MSLPQILNKSTESKTTGGGRFDQNDAGQNSHCNDVIDLKSIRVNTSSSTIPTQLWNLPSRNSFTSYAKPLPAVPKILPNS
uniref:Uncharacterized protein n=3 Tax=Octopus bimaculoides TaxID=37653 RepID=A0A0L8GV70_OCTBM